MAICPGQDRRLWHPEDIVELACERCGQELEFFKDEGVQDCPVCGKRVVNPKVSMGCAQWCAHARECLGYDPQAAPPVGGSQTSLAARLIAAMQAEFGDDRRRIEHALAVLDLAEQILVREKADPRVVVAAAILHDIGIQAAERKYGSAAGCHQEVEGPPIATRMLRSVRFAEEAIGQVCQIIAHHHRGGLETSEFRILWDADNLVNARDDGEEGEDRQATRRRLARILRTEAGRQLADSLFADPSTPAATAGGEMFCP